MKKKNKIFMVFIFVLNQFFFGDSIGASNYDGDYQAKLTCGPNASKEPGWEQLSAISIKNGLISNRDPVKNKNDYLWSGKIIDGKVEAKVNWTEKQADVKYLVDTTGKAISRSTIFMTGDFFNNGNKRRDCVIIFTEANLATQNQQLNVQPPAPVAATNNSPARPAAVGNVTSPSQSSGISLGATQQTQVTTNPLDLQKKTNPNEVWISFNPSVTVQERQFCRIVENFRTENTLAQETKNQIKVNETFKNLVQSLNSLLPDGKFQGWVMRTVYVSQATNGDAEVLLELPCNVYVGSNACDMNPKNYYGTAPEGSRLYTELAKMTVGDFALTSGSFVYAHPKAFDKSRSVASFGYMKTATHCTASKISADSDFFGLTLEVISTLK